MQIQINKEFRDYREKVYFGLSMRQLIFSFLAVGVAIVSYILFKDKLSTDTISWLCILLAAPFAALGFVTYHGMTFEKFAWAWIKSEVLIPKRLVFKAESKTHIENKEMIKQMKRRFSRIMKTRNKMKNLNRKSSLCPKLFKMLFLSKPSTKTAFFL